jgi:DNA-binding MarR family transcriptional regulator
MEYTRAMFLMQQIYATLFSLANKLQVKADQQLKHLTARQLMTLIAIGHLPEGEASLNNIARKLGTTKQSIKQLVTLIEKNGYVVTVPSPRDKRAVNIVITESGYRALLEDGMLGMAYFNDLFHEFSQDEMEVLWNLLKKLYRYDGEEQDGFEGELRINQSTNGER